MFRGSMVALVTPMREDGVIDIESLRQLAEWHIEQGTNAIVVLGSTGESATLDRIERKIVMEVAMEQVQGRVPIIAGTGTNSTSSTLELTQEAMELGVDACLLVTPYYNKPTQEGLYQHFKTIAEKVAIPQILYNVPSRTGCDLKPTTIAHLAAVPNIIGIKEATGDLQRVKEILSLTNGRGLDLYSGDDATSLDFIMLGGRGVISVTANIVPKWMHAICEHALSGEENKARILNSKLEKLHRQLFVESNPIPVKWVLQQMGKIQKGIRLPLTYLSEAYHALLKEAMIEAGIVLT